MALYPLAYSYIKVPPNPAFPQGHIAPRPIVRLALVNAERRLSCYALIDSGADHCVFPRSFLQPLGLDALAAPVAMSAGFGSAGVPTHFANISIDLPGVIKFPVYAGFTSALDRMGLGLLGQSGFFDRFNVSFRLVEKICLIEVPEPPAV
ncbi:MAG TPA: hypothetical protein VJW94_14095 [Candidatus Acidoferrum sp.]|nr:hypothetical protein [Candidatus Acidoferrum sp.]